MTKLLYLPFSIVSGLIARVIGRKLFSAVWSRVDDEPPPKPGDGRDTMAKVIGGRALQAAVMTGSAAAIERLIARLFHHLFGTWPKKPPKPDDN